MKNSWLEEFNITSDTTPVNYYKSDYDVFEDKNEFIR